MFSFFIFLVFKFRSSHVICLLKHVPRHSCSVRRSPALTPADQHCVAGWPQRPRHPVLPLPLAHLGSPTPPFPTFLKHESPPTSGPSGLFFYLALPKMHFSDIHMALFLSFFSFLLKRYITRMNCFDYPTCNSKHSKHTLVDIGYLTFLLYFSS